ncbi:hypothetical protein RHMOL_Rhmol08G0115900 [Rhododendron molle]|uniref:Uncharacterized protein n=1 Tax=Rhododendron molle TaxID=49168 RepID=A0ACC0MMC9_RHOML|nr:hypothetical protein RHMOL_Rhmol08G0115900 [Rhododendron molle]
MLTGPPAPSGELGYGAQAKAWSPWLLERRATRKAGFTEQRSPPAPYGGRITGRCFHGPIMPDGLAYSNVHLFSFYYLMADYSLAKNYTIQL